MAAEVAIEGKGKRNKKHPQDMGDITKFHSKNQPEAKEGADALAEEVNTLYRAMAKRTMVDAWEIGKKLIMLRDMVRVDAWEKFVAKKLDFHIDHVKKLIRVGSLPFIPEPKKLLSGPIVVLNIDELAKVGTAVADGGDAKELLEAAITGKVLEKEEKAKSKGNGSTTPFSAAGSNEPAAASPKKPSKVVSMDRDEALAVIGITGANVHIEEEILDVIFKHLQKVRKSKEDKKELALAMEVLK